MANMVQRISADTDVPEEKVRNILNEFLAETGLDRLLSDTVLDGIHAVPTADQPVLSTFKEASAA